jgi:DNA-binding NarL/FixJ family response regulator
MPSAAPATIPPPLRVLVVDGGRPASVALADWLRGHAGMEVRGPAASLAAGLALAATFRPQVVLLDFHGLPVSVGYMVALFKELAPPPLAFVLTHEASAAMRRRCAAARVDAVFDKTAELEALVHRLATIPVDPAGGSEPEDQSRPGESSS